MKAYKGFFAIVLVMAMLMSMAVMGVSAIDIDSKDTSSPKAQLSQYICKELYKEMCTTGTSWKTLVDTKADELGLTSSEAFKVGIDTGIYRYYTKDEIPVTTMIETQPPSTENSTEATESTPAATDPKETTAATEPAESTPIATEPAETTAAIAPTEPATLPEDTKPAETEPSEVTTPSENITEPTENVTEPSENTTEPTENVTEPATDVPPATEDQETGTNRYYFYKPGYWFDNEYSDTVGIYWWEGTGACSSWPGYEAKKGDVEGVYYYDVPKDVTAIIWNNYVDSGADPVWMGEFTYQTVNIGTEYYDPEECPAYPNGTTSFDGMIFVTHTLISTSAFGEKLTCEGTWYYYYGNGEYGITPEKGDKFYTGSFQVDMPSSAEYEDIFYILGDVNYDRKLNIKDATAIQKYVAKLNAFAKDQVFLADFNEDLTVNVKDATTIQKKIAGLI